MIYVLSILDRLGTLFVVLGGSGIAAAGVLGISAMVNRSDSQYRPEALESKAEAATAVAYFGMSRKLLILALGSLVFGALLPSRRSLLEATLMVEGGKVATAANAEKAVNGAVQRVDRLIGVLEKAASK